MKHKARILRGHSSLADMLDRSIFDYMPNPRELTEEKVLDIVTALSINAYPVGQMPFLRAFFKLWTLIYHNPARNPKGIHPSSYPTDCNRKIWYWHYHEEDALPMERVISSTLERTFLYGTFWHTFVQVLLYEQGVLTTAEVPVVSKRYLVDGRADGIIILDGKKYVLEIKTVSSNVWRLLPLPDHLTQANTYLGILRLESIPDLAGIVILYINKDNSTFREFVLAPDESRITSFFSKANVLADHVESGVAPKRVCSGPDDARARVCPFSHICFSKT